MKPSTWRAAGFFLVGISAPAGAQSLQRLSIQGSGAVLFATQKEAAYQSKTRLGWEGQLRYTFGRLSLGAGYQRSTVFAFVEGTPPPTLQLSFGFVEPRYVLKASRMVAFYLAGRIGAGKLVSGSSDFNVGKTSIGYGGGGGFLIRLTSRVSADLGEVRGDLPSRYAMVRVGLGLGL